MKIFKKSFFLFLLILIVIFFLLFRNTSNKKNQPASRIITPTPSVYPTSNTTIQPLPLEEKFPTSTSNITYSYVGQEVSFPPTLPIFAAVENQSLLTNISHLANEWGFKATPKRPVSYVTDWIEADKILTFNEKSKGLSFALSGTQSRTPSFFTTSSSMFSTLIGAGFLSDDFDYVVTDTTIGDDAEGANSSHKITIQTFASLRKSFNFPFYYNGMTRAVGEIRTTESGQLISFAFFSTPKLQEKRQETTLSLEQILQALSEGKGFVSGVSGSTNYPFDEAVTATHINIQKISISYLFLTGDSVFIPVYEILGQGIGGKQNQTVRLFLRATK